MCPNVSVRPVRVSEVVGVRRGPRPCRRIWGSNLALAAVGEEKESSARIRMRAVLGSFSIKLLTAHLSRRRVRGAPTDPFAHTYHVAPYEVHEQEARQEQAEGGMSGDSPTRLPAPTAKNQYPQFFFLGPTGRPVRADWGSLTTPRCSGM